MRNIIELNQKEIVTVSGGNYGMDTLRSVYDHTIGTAYNTARAVSAKIDWLTASAGGIIGCGLYIVGNHTPKLLTALSSFGIIPRIGSWLTKTGERLQSSTTKKEG